MGWPPRLPQTKTILYDIRLHDIHEIQIDHYEQKRNNEIRRAAYARIDIAQWNRQQHQHGTHDG